MRSTSWATVLALASVAAVVVGIVLSGLPTAKPSSLELAKLRGMEVDMNKALIDCSTNAGLDGECKGPTEHAKVCVLCPITNVAVKAYFPGAKNRSTDAKGTQPCGEKTVYKCTKEDDGTWKCDRGKRVTGLGINCGDIPYVVVPQPTTP